MINKVIYSVGGFFLVISISLGIGLGVWALSLNTQLTQSQADYRPLKSSNDKVNGDYNKLNIEATKSQTDLAAANAQVIVLQEQLKKAQDENLSLNARLTDIQGKVAILYTSEFGSVAAIDAKIDGSGDDQLKQFWAAEKKSRSNMDNINFWPYIIQSIAKASGLSLEPFPVETGALIIPVG